MPRQTQRSSDDKPSLFEPRDFSSSGGESSEAFSPHDLPRRERRQGGPIPPPNMKVPPGNRGPLWNRPQPQTHQLPMFMSAREIRAQYQPLEGDRQDAYDWREGQPTGRAFNTAGQKNETIRSKDESWLRRRGGMQTGDTHYRISQPETDEQLWNRKLEESMMPKYEYREVHGGGGSSERALATPGYETLMNRSSAQERHPFPSSSAGSGTWEQHQMDVDEYIGRRQEEHRWNREADDETSLHGQMTSAMRPGGEGFKGVIHLGTGGMQGTSDRPQVYGAHHRIAAMSDIDPDRLMPVLHHRQFSDARAISSGPYKYT